MQVVIEGRLLHTDSKPFFTTRPKLGEGRSSQDHTLLGVEGYAMGHYLREKEWPCALHAENSTFSMLFALLMWEVLFAPVPDVFRAAFQVCLLPKSHYPNSQFSIHGFAIVH